MKTMAGIILALLASEAYAMPHGGISNPGTLGGISIGSQGASGIYSGYTLASGDNFQNSLNIVNVNQPNAAYFPTIAYEGGERTTGGFLSQQWDSDPFYTGSNDSNRGVPVGSTNMSQSNSLLTLQARIANSSETPNISGRTYVTSMIHTGGYVSVTPPFIAEAYIKFSGGTLPSGWHPTFWLLNTSPVSEILTPGGLEFDMEANALTTAPTALSNNVNKHGTVAGWSGSVNETESVLDGNYHLLSMVLTSSSIKYYVDGSLVTTVSGDTTATANPYYLLFSNHIINPGTPSDWTGATESMNVSYYRIWMPNSGYPSHIIHPTQNLPNLQVAYNTSMTYTFPAAATLWGSSISDYCQGIKFEGYEPGSNDFQSSDYAPFPAGLSYNSTTRVLTGITSDNQPGRIHVACIPNVAGGAVGYAARGYIDVGPYITTSTLNATHGTPFSYDVYPDAKCGTLVPKVLTVTGLPSGLSFSPSTGLITGTPTSTGTTTITIGVTNASGQNVTKNVSIVVS